MSIMSFLFLLISLRYWTLHLYWFEVHGRTNGLGWKIPKTKAFLPQHALYASPRLVKVSREGCPVIRYLIGELCVTSDGWINSLWLQSPMRSRTSARQLRSRLMVCFLGRISSNREWKRPRREAERSGSSIVEICLYLWERCWPDQTRRVWTRNYILCLLFRCLEEVAVVTETIVTVSLMKDGKRIWSDETDVDLVRQKKTCRHRHSQNRAASEDESGI